MPPILVKVSLFINTKFSFEIPIILSIPSHFFSLRPLRLCGEGCIQISLFHPRHSILIPFARSSAMMLFTAQTWAFADDLPRGRLSLPEHCQGSLQSLRGFKFCAVHLPISDFDF